MKATKSAIAAVVTSTHTGDGQPAHKYQAIPAEDHGRPLALDEEERDKQTLGVLAKHLSHFQNLRKKRVVVMVCSLAGLALFLWWIIP